MKKQLIYLLLFLYTGCSIFESLPPGNELKGDNVVCILFKDRKFKIEVAGNLTKAFSPKRYRVITSSVKQAKYYNAADYAAVVYMAELWAWHTPWHATKYHRNNIDAKNIVFVITSGDPDVVIKEPFDAVTTASKPDRVKPVVQEIMSKLENILQ